MAESTRLVDLVQSQIDDFLDARDGQLTEIAPELDPFVDFSRALLRGGKRFRALFCYWGWQAIVGLERDLDPLAETRDHDDLPAVVLAATALEVFHAAALVHDDIMDNSDTRRGLPAAHRRFEERHRQGQWLGDGSAFGRSAALLLGDLLLGWSDDILDTGLSRLRQPAWARSARLEFNRMRTEVMLGQYLDVLEEQSWHTHPETEQLERAYRVIVYKSAKYSVEAPLVIGATLAGGSLGQVQALREFGLPLGIAYQLRDDMLGVFGDPDVTGKPSGDDLREGKRTVLIALARTKLPATARRLFDELLGDPELTDDQVAMLQQSIRDCGAVDQVEQIIGRNVRDALAGISEAPLSPAARRQLTELAHAVSRRDS